MPRSGDRPRFNPFGSRRNRRDEFVMRTPRQDLASKPLTKVGEVEAARIRTTWQAEAFLLCASVGEVGYVLNLTANVIARGVLKPQVQNEQGEWIDAEDEALLRVTRNLISPGAGQNELLRRMALILQIAGEGYLVGTNIYDEVHNPKGIAWEFLSTMELKIDRGKVVRKPQGYGISYELPENTFIARMLQSDPQYSDIADSVIKRLMPILREIVLLTQVVDAIAKSRLSAGIFYIPEEISIVGASGNEWEDPSNPATGDEFEDVFIRQITAPIEDRSDAASLVPLIMTGPADLFGKMGLIETARGLDSLYADLRAEALRRLSSGLNIPPEILQGKGGLNHWTGYNVDAEYLTRHVQPHAELMTDFLTQAYFRPMLQAFETDPLTNQLYTPEKTQNFRLWLDLSAVQARVNAGDTARQAYDRYAISRETYLRENGLTPNDLPSLEEEKMRFMLDLMRANPAYVGPLIGKVYPDLADLKDVLPDPAAPASGANADGARPAPGVPRAEEPPQIGQPSLPEGKGSSQKSITDEGSLVDRLAVAASSELDRALERAANRLLSRLQGDKDMVTKLKGVSRFEVLSTAGEGLISTTGMSIDDLFRGAWDTLNMNGRGWVQVYLEDAGVPALVAENQARIAMDKLSEKMLFLAASSLRGPIKKGTNGLKVSHELVVEALEATAGLDEFAGTAREQFDIERAEMEAPPEAE